MPKLIKNLAVIDNEWLTLEKDATSAAITDNSLVPVALYLENVATLAGNEKIGVWIDSDERADDLQPHLKDIAVIAINFPKFVDGRGYSIARILRDQLGYKGELRAIGDVLHDQLFYLKRCGFDSFAIREDTAAEAALSGLTDFSNSYQCAVDQPEPLFRRRI